MRFTTPTCPKYPEILQIHFFHMLCMFFPAWPLSLFQTNFYLSQGNSHHGSLGLESDHSGSDWCRGMGSIPGLAQLIEGSSIGCSCSSDLVPVPETSICHRCSHKKKKVLDFLLWLSGYRTRLVSMRTQFRSLALLSGFRIWRGCGIGQLLQLQFDS